MLEPLELKMAVNLLALGARNKADCRDPARAALKIPAKKVA